MTNTDYASIAEKAAQLKHGGFNCCQAVALALINETNLDVETLRNITAGFGAGMGTAQGVCGAMSGAALLAGLKNSDGDTDHPAGTKASTMKLVGGMQREFVQKAQRLICAEIKKGNNGKAFTSCDDCIRIATEIAGGLFD